MRYIFLKPNSALNININLVFILFSAYKILFVKVHVGGLMYTIYYANIFLENTLKFNLFGTISNSSLPIPVKAVLLRCG